MLRDKKYLDNIRTLPCCVCGNPPRSEAAHVRKGSNAGIGQKPHDNRVLPLCTKCHAEQHNVGELRFWYPFGGYEAAAVFANLLYNIRDSRKDMREEIVRFKNVPNN